MAPSPLSGGGQAEMPRDELDEWVDAGLIARDEADRIEEYAR
jgi:hypothetical protein